MLASSTTELLNEFERNFPVDRWVIQGIHIWPLIRINLTFSLACSGQADDEKKGNKKNRWINLLKLEIASLRGFAKFIHAYMTDYQKNSRPSKSTDCVFLCDGLSYDLINGYWFNIYCDPFIRHLKDRELSFFSMTTYHKYLTPRHNPSMFIEPKLDYLRFKSIFTRKSLNESKESLIGFDDFISYLKDKKLSIPLPDLLSIRNNISVVRVFTDFFIRILKAVRPSAVFLVCYYNAEGMALNLACRELGIPSIDIQHGFQGEFHPAYGRWNKVPETGFDLLPSLFWCWSQSEADAITQWSSKVAKFHKPIVVGNLWLAEWQCNNDFVRYFDEKINNIKKSKPAAMNVLVTLSLAESQGIEPVFHAMTKSDPSWRWWIRLHPAQVDRMQEMEQLLYAHGIKNYELDSATDLPLYALLRHMDIHLTQYSSVVIEAEAFGVPSVVTNEYGRESFPVQITTGWAVAAYSAEDILAAIRLQLNRRDVLRESRMISGNSVNKGLAFLLSLIEENRVKHDLKSGDNA